MKVAYALCGLALILQATHTKARGVRGDLVALESYVEPSVSESYELPLEIDVPTVEEDPVYGDYTYDAIPLESNLPTSRTDDVLYGYEAPQNEWTIEAPSLPVEDDSPPVLDYVPSWEDECPPGWNGAGINPEDLAKLYGGDGLDSPISVEEPYKSDTPPTIEEPPVLGDYDYVPTWDDLHPLGWNDNGLPPQYLDNYDGGEEIVVPTPEADIPCQDPWDNRVIGAINPDEPKWLKDNPSDSPNYGYGDVDKPPMVVDEPPLVLDYVPSWEDERPPGWDNDGIPLQYLDGYTGGDGSPDSPYMVKEPPMIYDAPEWAPQEEPIPFMTDEGLNDIPPWYIRSTCDMKPSTSEVPPAWILDADENYEAAPVEWDEYLQKVKAMTAETNARARDMHAKALLDDITALHYANLHDCISKRIEPSILLRDVSNFANEINKSCYVKFRYSLFAGAAPFEWVVHKKPEISADDISKRFVTKFQVAKSDVAAGCIRAEPLQAISMIEKSMLCLNNVLKSHMSDPSSISLLLAEYLEANRFTSHRVRLQSEVVRLVLEHLRHVLGHLRQCAAREENGSGHVATSGARDPVVSARPASQEEHDGEELADRPERSSGSDRDLNFHHRD